MVLKVKWYKQNKPVEVYKFKTKDTFLEIAFTFNYIFVLWKNQTLQTIPDQGQPATFQREVYKDVKIVDLKLSGNTQMFALDHGSMSKAIIMNNYKMHAVNVYDTGFITPIAQTWNISNPIDDSVSTFTSPQLIKGG